MPDSDKTMVSGRDIIGSSVRADQDYRVKVYDFKRPDKFSAEQIRTLFMIHDAMIRHASPLLNQVAAQPVQARCTSVDQMTYQEFVDAVPPVCALVPMSLSPLRGPMLLELDGDLAHTLARAACGSHSGGNPQTTESLSEMECLVVKDIADRLAPSFDEAWFTAIEITALAMDLQTDPQSLMIVPPSEMVVFVQFEVVVGSLTSHINVAIPFLTIEPILSRLSATWWFSQVRDASVPRVARGATDVPVEMQLVSEAAPIPISALGEVLAGEPVFLPALAGGRATVIAGGVPVAEVAVEVPLLSVDPPLVLPVVSHRTPAPGETSSLDHQVSVAGLLSNAVESLTHHMREIKDSIREMRDDRESLLVDIDRGEDLAAGVSELKPRNHREIALELAAEPPEIIAFVLTGLSPDLAASVLSDLGPEVQPAVVRCIAAVRDGDRLLHAKLVTHLARRISRAAETTTDGGPEAVAEVLNHVPRSVERRVMDEFQKNNKPLFESVARLMFVFEDFVLVDSQAVRKVVERVSVDECALALKGVPDEVVSHILTSIDPETQRQISAAGEELGRVRLRDVEAAQRDPIEELRQLEEQGEVVVARPEEVVD